MKNITKINENLFHVISEPGDATRYDYFIFIDYDDYDECCFMPCRSTFRYPQWLNYWDVKDISEKDLIDLSSKEYCNPYTLKECIRTILELRA